MKSHGWWLLGLIFVPVACSLANAPDDPFEAEGGNGGEGGSGAAGGEGGSGAGPECTDNADCTALSDECLEGSCNGGVCEAVPLADGTPCGDDTTSECDAADACLAGVCEPNSVSNGTPCEGCPAGVGQCAGCQDGLCPDCATFATEQTFVTDASIAGWELTGSWGLYQEAPRNHNDLLPVDLPGLVFGTDGNRAKPYPGNEDETSYARTKPFILPATLTFASWHVDEGGGGIDNKAIRISIDGGNTWTPVAECNGGPLGAFPFCQFVGDPRPPNAWDDITIPVPAALVGVEGIVEFSYDTGDGCCSFERGWYLSRLNFATNCACQDAASCSWVSGECGTGSCQTSGECRLAPVPADTVCGEQTTTSTCDNPNTCDNAGYCRERNQPEGSFCFDCLGGTDECNECQEGACLQCNQFEPLNNFASSAHIQGWERTGGWNRYTSAPPSSFTTPVGFGDGAFGTDGNRVPPYPGNEVESSFARTRPFVVPNQITFQSWHVDEGSGPDIKKISLSTNMGMTWTPIVDCSVSGMNGYPFCTFFSTDRPAGQWDPVTIDTSAFAGQLAIMEFGYTTGDSCCSFERGWYIDNLNVTQRCLD